MDIDIKQDGDMRCATFENFTNLQECPAGFGKTDAEAVINLLKYQPDVGYILIYSEGVCGPCIYKRDGTLLWSPDTGAKELLEDINKLFNNYEKEIAFRKICGMNMNELKKFFDSGDSFDEDEMGDIL
jgi:hypothetical protein